ncbi:ADP-ribosylation factor-binding protein GGA1 isoform X2 [Onthophagus taurus]|uniref:ADP-ribosylation factor-binding protein GGA1 isoform X2 n=1 Tax=Onthophagus taurus TaxID=166361 RepID=UPI000C206D6F|nr:ADP-ribosylation factor-binding protein GGA3 isoform X2 [Onthophagus taurus]
MEIVKTSLDALLQRATNPLNQNVDEAAVEAFCVLVNKEKDGYHIGVKLLAARLHSKEEREVLQTLSVLDTCMQRCGNTFRSEVGKFRFLNEMIKLVSPKYLGLQTPMTVRHKVVRMIFWWTHDYPKETKIMEAYEMLRKQGLIKEVTVSLGTEEQANNKPKNSIFCDEEKSKLLQKLLQSKNPEDLQAANRLIKCMVKEDDKRAELKSRKILEVESVYSNVRLLKEMLESYNKNGGTPDDLALIREIHQNCERLQPKIHSLATECQQNDDMIGDLLNASDELCQVFEDYKRVIIDGKTEFKTKNLLLENGPSLLDLGVNKTDAELLLETKQNLTEKIDSKPGYDVLCDIFSNESSSVMLGVDADILKPTSLVGQVGNDSPKLNGKLKAFEELDALGENLLKQNLQLSTRQGHQFQKLPEKVPMNMLSKQNSTTKINTENNERKSSSIDPLDFDLTYLLEKQSLNSNLNPSKNNDQNGDDLLVDITEEIEKKDEKEKNKLEVSQKNDEPKESLINNESKVKMEVKLTDIFVAIESIKPSTIPPLIALEEKSGISVTLHFARDKPREDVSVIVVTIISKNELPLKNILFRAIVPKVCKVKLQPPSATDLPPFNPFLPPSAITQVMLIANPENVNVSLKFIVSYNIDEETTTEMGEIESLPNVEKNSNNTQ